MQITKNIKFTPKIIKYAILTVMVIGVAAGIFAAHIWLTYNSQAVTKDNLLYIPTNATYSQLVDSIKANNIVENNARFEKYAKQKKLNKKIIAGRYEMTKGMSYRTLINTLLAGRQKPLNVTFNNIRTKEKLAAVVAKYIEADSTALITALNSDSVSAKYGFLPETFIGMFIPNTYQFFWNTSVDGFLERMNSEYKKFWNETRNAKLKENVMTRDQAVTLASIVAEETRMSDEMARVAGVYVNRLRIGMPLQADPTVKFGVGDFTLRRILYKHLAVDSPYNTYKNKGLPPGPICMPSIKAVDAVLNYEKHKYLYFCAKEDFSGYHNFAVNLAEHNGNARRYSAALNKRGIK